MLRTPSSNARVPELIIVDEDEDDSTHESKPIEDSTTQSAAAAGSRRVPKPKGLASCVARRTRSQLLKQSPIELGDSLEVKEEDSGDSDDSSEVRNSFHSSEEKDDGDNISREIYHNAAVDDGTQNPSKMTVENSTEEKEKVLGEDSVRKRKFGMDILVSNTQHSTSTSRSGNIAVARRTRSHFAFVPDDSKEKLGTMRNPYRVELDEPETDYDSESSSSDEAPSNGEDEVGGNGREEEMGGQQRLQQGGSNKRKRVQALKAESLFKLLVDTILNKPEKLPEELLPQGDKPPRIETSPSCDEDLLPLVFSFADEDPKPVEKLEYESGVEEIWADFDFATGLKNVGTYRNCEGHTEEVNLPLVKLGPSALCPRTEKEHQFILDDQIGIRCKFCYHVKQNVRDILPSWAIHSPEKSARKTSTVEESHFTFDDISTTVKSQGLHGVVNGTVWDLIPRVHKTMYLHQREAFELMWQNLAGGIHLDKLKSAPNADDIGGCVISHAPGTGKTRLAIVFIQTYMKIFPECRPVIIAPCGILQTWKREFKKWDIPLPLHLLNLLEYSGKEDDTVCKLVQKRSRKWIRIVKLYSWAKGNSVLGISYGLFKRLTDRSLKSDSRSEEIRKILLEKPGLIVLDEGHTPRNDRTLLWKALGNVKTEQRIILSGTPFQNNFGELYNTLRLVRPKFAEKILPKTFRLCQRRAKFISDNAFSRVNDGTLEELRSIIKPFVHVSDGKILENLPGLRDCLVILDPLPQQKYVLGKIDDTRSSSVFENEYKISLASIHPSLITSISLSENERSFIDVGFLETLRLDPNAGVKTRFVIELVRLSATMKEKVVVFSQFLQPLGMIKDQLIEQFDWTQGKEVLQMDGKIPSLHRQSSIDIFNDFTSDARVLLASTKACCEGISLIGASRVVLLDIVWNPSVERQAISRAYRMGQEKVVYTYRLITSGTSEGEKYETQARKNNLSKLVFSPEMELDDVVESSSLSRGGNEQLVSEDRILREMTGHEKLKHMFVKIYYPRKESNVMHGFG